MFPDNTPEQDLLEALLEIERKPLGERTPEETAQMEAVAAWYADAGRVWGCRCYEDVWRQDYEWPRREWTIAARDYAIRVVRAARFAFVLARVPKERVSCYRVDGMELWLLTRAQEQQH
jgi:hypothetical protein